VKLKCPFCGAELILAYFEPGTNKYYPRLNSEGCIEYGDIADFFPRLDLGSWWECDACGEKITTSEEDAVEILRGNLCGICDYWDSDECELGLRKAGENKKVTECPKYKPIPKSLY